MSVDAARGIVYVPTGTTLIAYDLNTGVIARQKGLGDDLRLLPRGITGTGSAATVKGGLIAIRYGYKESDEVGVAFTE